jgi:outer membrane protein TolC
LLVMLLGTLGRGRIKECEVCTIAEEAQATFHSLPLNELVEDALKHNADLQSAQAALLVAMKMPRRKREPSGRKLAAIITAIQKVASEVSPPGATTSDYLALHTAQLDVSYAPDVFGLVRREVESAEAQTAAQQYQLEATYLTLTSNVAAAAVQEASCGPRSMQPKKINWRESAAAR